MTVVFMDSMNNRELREQILIQKCYTMEEALRMATHIEAIDALETPKVEVRDRRHMVQSLEQDSGAGAMKEVGGQLAAVHTSRNQAGIPVDSIVDVGADTCRYCKNLGHWIYNCPRLKQKDTRANTSRNQAGIPVDSIVDVGADTCRYCKNLGHWIYNCPMLKEKNARAKLQRKADPEK